MLLHLFTPTLSFWLVIGGIFNITGCKIYRVPGCTPPPQCHVSTQANYGLFVWDLWKPTHHPLSKPALASARYGISKLWSEGRWHTLGCDLPGSETVGDAKKSTTKIHLFFFQFHSEKCFPCVFFLVGDFLLMMKNDTSWTGNTEKRTVYLKVWEKFLDALIHVSFEGIWIREYQQTFFPANAEVHVPRDSHTTFNEFSQVRSQFFHHWIWRMRI